MTSNNLLDEAVAAGLDAAYQVKARGYLGSNMEEKLRVAIRAALTRILELGSPYGVRQCRGHWHVTNGEYDIFTDAGDAFSEDLATAQAAKMNVSTHYETILQRLDFLTETGAAVLRYSTDSWAVMMPEKRSAYLGTTKEAAIDAAMEGERWAVR